MIRRTLLICCTLLTLTAGALEPPEIDPLDTNAGAFLGVDYEAEREAAWEAYQAADYLAAARHYLAYLRGRPGDATSIYNLACCYGLLDEPELAARFLDLAVQAGFEDAWLIAEDGDFDAVRDDEVFQRTAAEAVATIEAQYAAMPPIAFTTTPTPLPYHLIEPTTIEEGEPLTLIVALHGYGSNPTRFSKLAADFGSSFIFCAPRAPHPYSTSSVGYSWLWWDENGLIPGALETAENYILELVEELRTEYAPERVFLMGFSQGAGMTYDIAIKHPGVFDGALPFGGWLDQEEGWFDGVELSAAAQTPFFIAHGNADGVVPFEAGLGAAEMLTALGAEVTFHEFDGGHQVPAEAVAAAVEWIKSLD